MTKDLDANILNISQHEIEKQLFGGNIYALSHKFPTLCIINNIDNKTDYNYHIEYFTIYVNLIKGISDKCGSDLALLFSEVYNLYNIEDEIPNYNNVKNKMIVDFCTESLAHISLALNQSEKIIEKINNNEKNKDINIEISGKDYCFIVMMLNNLFYYYTTIINFIINKRYLNNEFISSISERLCFIVSEEFESMRRMFKVIECYKEIESTTTFH
jgi:hypothetical protein